MRILTFVDTEQITPESRLALAIAENARGAGHEAILAGLARGKEPPAATPLGQAADERRVPFRLLLQRRPLDPGILGQMETMFRRIQPNAFISHDWKGALLYRLARWRPPAWQAVALGAGAGSDGRLAAWAERRCLQRADKLVASETAARTLADWKIEASRIAIVRAGAEDPEAWSRALLDGLGAMDARRALPS